ncbi:basic proline-rich protein-like [Prinia subflava]|uniref:basic proline-rich protein-like n=1 Tax=Prinia subflava TaxID=208062 RepID=UPI002FE41521
MCPGPAIGASPPPRLAALPSPLPGAARAGGAEPAPCPPPPRRPAQNGCAEPGPSTRGHRPSPAAASPRGSSARPPREAAAGAARMRGGGTRKRFLICCTVLMYWYARFQLPLKERSINIIQFLIKELT